MVFLNKAVLGDAKGNTDDVPLFVTSFQCFVSVLLCLLLSKISASMPKVLSFPNLGAVQWLVVKKVRKAYKTIKKIS